MPGYAFRMSAPVPDPGAGDHTGVRVHLLQHVCLVALLIGGADVNDAGERIGTALGPKQIIHPLPSSPHDPLGKWEPQSVSVIDSVIGHAA